MGFLSRGKEKEKEFGNIFKDVILATEKEDINEHWDLKIPYNGVEYKKFDVKGLKKINRVDPFTNENYHYIELKNVNGDSGWLYGEADYFTFEINEYWIIVDKAKLQELIKTKVTKKMVSTPDEALYCLYRRSDRKDVITLVKTIDLILIMDSVISKNSNVIEHKPGNSIIEDKRIKGIISDALNNKK